MNPADALEGLIRDALEVQAIPAPTGEEHDRARWVADRFQAAGLDQVSVDDAPNAYGRVAGHGRGGTVMVSAHLDTVFPRSTDLAARRDGSMLHGPGIADNSMGVAAVVRLARTLAADAWREPPRFDTWLVANAAEEGLGDLRGMRRALERLGADLAACIVVEGGGGERWRIVNAGLGSLRLEVTCRAPGGHSWSDFGSGSAVHELCRAVVGIADMTLPDAPRASLNVGTIHGGTSVNTIAEEATALVDLRSVDPDALDALAARAEGVLRDADRSHDAVSITWRVVGDRPAGAIPDDHPLVEAARDALVVSGADESEIELACSSTDANVPLARGIPAVTVHLSRSYDTHRLSEHMSTERLPTSVSALERLARRAGELA